MIALAAKIVANVDAVAEMMNEMMSSEAVRQEILAQVPEYLPNMTARVARLLYCFPFEVTAVIWEMVDEGLLTYGADAVVRRCEL